MPRFLIEYFEESAIVRVFMVHKMSPFSAFLSFLVAGSAFAGAVTALIVVLCLIGAIALIGWFFSEPEKPRYRTVGTLVHRAYSKGRWAEDYPPASPSPDSLAFLALATVNPVFLVLAMMPPPVSPFVQPRWVPPQPHLLIQVDGVKAWMACTQDAYNTWPNGNVTVEYEVPKPGEVRILNAWR